MDRPMNTAELGAGVKVLALMNYSRFEPDVAAKNHITAQLGSGQVPDMDTQHH